MNCRICNSSSFRDILDLGHHPPSDAFLAEKDLLHEEVHYPLKLVQCKSCNLVQLSYVVPKENLFNENYPYTTGSNRHGVMHFHKMAKDIVDEFRLPYGSNIVDIGSNDGTLLSGFRDIGMNVLGIEPCKNISDIANKAGIRTIPCFWGNWTALHVRDEVLRGYADVITATNVFAHIDDLRDVMKGVDILLDDEGVFVIEAPSLSSLVKNLAYDTVYHEHLSYLDPMPLEVLFNQYDMEIFKVERQDIHGGTNRYFICRKGAHPQQEIAVDFVRMDDFQERVDNQRNVLVDMLRNIKKSCKRIVGVSAPAKGNTLLNYCRIGRETLDFITERSELKIGKYTPGMHIPVVHDEELKKYQPDYALLLAWNFKEQIIQNAREAGYSGRFIIPLPVPEIV